ncbi:MAG: A24 family peptidase [Anaerolineae bacterium]|nr:A24 family peptidase [Anaerolineae bacterium]
MIVLYALLGLLLGAGINLCADQLPRWRTLRRTPFCPYCQEPRPEWAWIGTLAYLRFRRNCARCGAAIPWRVPLVELGTAALSAFLWYQYHPQPTLLGLYSLYSLILVLVLVIDLEHRLILNVVMYPAWLLAILGSFVHPEPYFYRLALLGGAVGFALLFLVYLLGELFVKVMSRARGKPIHAVAFGFGDVRLGAFIGLMLGFPQVLSAVFLAVLLGGVIGLIYWFVQAIILRSYSLFTAIPYGPFLVAGAATVLFFGPF